MTSADPGVGHGIANASDLLSMQQAITRALWENGPLPEVIGKLVAAVRAALKWELAMAWGADRRTGTVTFQAAWHAPGAQFDAFEKLKSCRLMPRQLLTVEGSKPPPAPLRRVNRRIHPTRSRAQDVAAD